MLIDNPSNFMAAMTAGANLAQGDTNAYRKALAYNALRKTYGDVAGDPNSANLMQQYAYNQTANPLRIQGLQTSNALGAQKYGFENQMDPALLQSQAIKNNTAQATQAPTIAAATAKANLTTAAANKAQSDNEQMAVHAVVSNLKQVLASGGNVVQAFDQLTPTIAKQFPGVDPQHLALIRQGLTTHPAQTLAAFDSQSATPQMITANATAQRQANAQQLLGPQVAKAKADALVAQNKAKTTGLGLSPADQLEKIQSFRAKIKAAIESAKDAGGFMGNFSSPVLRQLLAKSGATPEGRFLAAVAPLSSNNMQQEFTNMVQQGVHMGRASSYIGKLGAESYGSLDVSQKRAILQRNLASMSKLYTNIYNALGQDEAAARGALPIPRGMPTVSGLSNSGAAAGGGSPGPADVGAALLKKYKIK